MMMNLLQALGYLNNQEAQHAVYPPGTRSWWDSKRRAGNMESPAAQPCTQVGTYTYSCKQTHFPSLFLFPPSLPSHLIPQPLSLSLLFLITSFNLYRSLWSLLSLSLFLFPFFYPPDVYRPSNGTCVHSPISPSMSMCKHAHTHICFIFYTVFLVLSFMFWYVYKYTVNICLQNLAQ